MPQNFYIADLHINHARAIKYDNRPFSTVEEMNEKLIENWNSVVGKNDTVYVIGDFIWDNENKWPTILEQLKGSIVLITGNHDNKSFSKKTKCYFADIKDYKEIIDNGRKVILCHYAIPFFNHDFEENAYMLYGHVHNSIEYQFLKDLKLKIKESQLKEGPRGYFYNVGCMMTYMDYKPRTLDEIIESNK